MLSLVYVRLNLFNHVLALFCAKFSYNFTIRYPIFRRELYKGNAWESVKKAQKVCTQEEPRDWLVTGKSPEWHTCEACRGSWRVTPAVALQNKTFSLAKQLAQDSNSNSWLVPVARLSHQNTLFGCNWLFAFLIHHTMNTLIPTKCWELPKRILREKP